LQIYMQTTKRNPELLHVYTLSTENNAIRTDSESIDEMQTDLETEPRNII